MVLIVMFNYTQLASQKKLISNNSSQTFERNRANLFFKLFSLNGLSWLNGHPNQGTTPSRKQGILIYSKSNYYKFDQIYGKE